MLRPNSSRTILESASALALVSMLAACSQPASFATVDLSGSNGGSSQTAQAYSPVTGQPVYQSTSLYGPQSFPDAAQYQPTSQFAAVDVPQNQVASLGYAGGGFDTFGILDQQQSIPQYAPVASSPVFQQQQLLASPQFQSEIQSVDRAFIDTGPLGSPAPFAEAESLLDIAPFEPLTQNQPDAFEPTTVEPVAVEITRQPVAPAPPVEPRRTVIEEVALAPLTVPSVPVQLNRDLEAIAGDYTTPLEDQAALAAPAPQVPSASEYRGRYDAWDAPRYGAAPAAPEPAPQSVQPPARAEISQQPLPFLATPRVAEQTPRTQPVLRAGPDSAFTDAARELLEQAPQRVRLPAPSVVPSPQLRLGGGGTVPNASAEYPRPYELLRPGVWPELEMPGQGMVQAPTPTPLPQFASLPASPTLPPLEAQAIDRASEREASTYEIKRGDTFLTIAQRVGTTPEALAFENGFTPEAKIYIGQRLILPPRPASSTQGLEYENVSLAAVEVDGVMAESSVIGGATVPVVDAAFIDTITESMPIQRASIPTRRATTSGDPAEFSWPVHGEVYRLDGGQVEIDAALNARVAASAAGKVVHVERGEMGVMVVIEHDNGWRSLTVGLDYSSVRPDDRVSQGDMIGQASRDHRVRFELRDADAGIADVLSNLRG